MSIDQAAGSILGPDRDVDYAGFGAIYAVDSETLVIGEGLSHEGWAWLVPSFVGIPPLHTSILELPTLAFTVQGGNAVSNYAAGQDFNGDGWADWSVFTETNEVGFIFGWDIPWDDPQYW